ncbi:hypothetical protein LJC42_07215 [Eubacteriales bacterium OttesenSCG-928-K08]|nr:hypothetical protein [Eubacteriales bacterium OttesenSCG-928-K08]
MEQKYADIYAMFRDNHEAWRFYNSLPGHVRDRICDNSAGTTTYSGLLSHADSLLSGGD